MANDYETKSRLIAKILREVLHSSSFESLADLTDALKCRLSALKIAAAPQDISDAYAMLASNIELASLARNLEPVREWHEQLPDTPTLNKSEAALIYRQLLAKYRAEQSSPTTPGAPEHFPALVMVR